MVLITNQVLQNTVMDIKGIARVDLCVVDLNTNVVAATFDSETEVKHEDIVYFISSGAESQMIYGCHYFKIYDEDSLEYILIVKGGSEDVYMIGRLAVAQIRALIVAYRENIDKNGFIRNILLDNLLPSDIYSTAQKVNIPVSRHRVVFLIETEAGQAEQVQRMVQEIDFWGKSSYAIVLTEMLTAVLKEMEEDCDITEDILQNIKGDMEKETVTITHIAYGTVVTDIKDVTKSYKQARMALEVGKIFYKEKQIVSYTTLGIGRLLYRIPEALCEMYVEEVLQKENEDLLDEEMMTTIQKFFINNLNIAETARQLFIHRNTLVYRLDKIQHHTGLDIREFEDAVTLKIALMVLEYLDYKKLSAVEAEEEKGAIQNEYKNEEI